jgi:hypothetical protein
MLLRKIACLEGDFIYDRRLHFANPLFLKGDRDAIHHHYRDFRLGDWLPDLIPYCTANGA